MKLLPKVKINIVRKNNFGRLCFNAINLLILSLSLSGCGFFFGDHGIFRSREGDYLKAESLPQLKVPETANKDALGELYPVPPITAADFGYDITASDYDVPRPLPLSANMLQDNVKMQRVGENSWILVTSSPGELWPRVRNFMNENNLAASKIDLKEGIIETQWLQFKDDLKSYSRYRLQIDQGVQPDTTEIHILHMSVVADQKPAQEIDWPARSTNPEKEKLLLDDLAASLASDTNTTGTSLLAQGIGGGASSKATLGMYRNEPVLNLKLDRVRTSATLSYALKHDGFQLYSSNTERGVYYAYYKNPEDAKPGWFKRFFHIGLHPKPASSPYTVDQLSANMLQGDAFEDAPFSNPKAEKLLKNAPGYLVVMTENHGAYLIRVRDPYGKRLKPKEARELITVIRKNLI